MRPFNKFCSPRDNQLCTSLQIRKLERAGWSRKGSFTSPACQAVLLIFVMHPDHLSVTSRHCIFTHKVKVKSLSRVRLFATPWIVAYQASPSTGLSRQEYRSGLPFPSPGDLTDPGITVGRRFYHLSHQGSHIMLCHIVRIEWPGIDPKSGSLSWLLHYHSITLFTYPSSPRCWGLVCLAYSSISRADTHKSA